jgi:hypothetical protein
MERAEKMLLNPRATTFRDWTPVVMMSTPGVDRRWSTAVMDGCSRISRSGMTERLAGASVAFSTCREADTTTASSSNAAVSRTISAVAVAPAWTVTSVARFVR